MDQTTIIILMVSMFVCVVLIAGGGYYYTTTLEEEDDDKKTGSCQGTDINAVYEYDANEDCSFTKCKDGYVRESGYCIRQRDYSAENNAGLTPKNCNIEKYIEGPCVDTNGRQLSGEPGRCGPGVKRFIADPDSFTMANSLGECENYSYTEACEVECKKVGCSATEENYTKTDGVCRGMNGEPIGGNTGKCGSGFQIFEVDPATAGNFATDELRDAWVAENWKDCTPLKKPCNVVCEPGMLKSDCPDLSEDMETSYVLGRNQEPGCFPKDYAVALLKGETRYDSYKAYEPLTRASAELIGITSMDQLPEGYRIRYKSGMADFNDYTIKGCTTAQLEPCIQPTESDDCVTGAEVVQACYDVGCGQQKKKKMNIVVRKEAWGLGSCDQTQLGEKIVECAEDKTLACCSADNDSHWTDPVTVTCSANGTYNLVNRECSTLGMTTPPTKTGRCCAVGEWEGGTCNQDGENGKLKQTRTIYNDTMCTAAQLRKGVWDYETFDISKPAVKYTPNINCGNLTGVKTLTVTSFGHPEHMDSGTEPSISFKTTNDTTVTLNKSEQSHPFETAVNIKEVWGKTVVNQGSSHMTVKALDASGNLLKTFSVVQHNNWGSLPKTIHYRTDAPLYKNLEPK
ncbi:MAG: hypothetical protein ACO3IK_04075 [Pelagibacteraceae bacterium]